MENGIKIIYDKLWNNERPVCLYFKNSEVYLNLQEFRNIFSEIIKEDFVDISFVLEGGGIVDLKLNNNEIDLYIDCNKDNLGKTIKVFHEDEENGFGAIIKKQDFVIGYNFIENIYLSVNN